MNAHATFGQGVELGSWDGVDVKGLPLVADLNLQMISAWTQGYGDFPFAAALVGVDSDVVEDLGEGGDKLGIEGSL